VNTIFTPVLLARSLVNSEILQMPTALVNCHLVLNFSNDFSHVIWTKKRKTSRFLDTKCKIIFKKTYSRTLVVGCKLRWR